MSSKTRSLTPVLALASNAAPMTVAKRPHILLISLLFSLVYWGFEAIFLKVEYILNAKQIYELSPILTDRIFNGVVYSENLSFFIHHSRDRSLLFIIKWLLITIPFALTWVGAYIAVSSRTPFQVLYVCILGTVGLYEYASFQTQHRFSDFYEWEVTLITTWTQKLGAIESLVTLTGLIPCIFLLVAIFCSNFLIKKKRTLGLQGLLMIISFSITFYGLVSYTTARAQMLSTGNFLSPTALNLALGDSPITYYLRNNFPKDYPNNSLQSFLRKSVQFSQIYQLRFTITREELNIASTSIHHQNNNIVLIIDESVNASHLDINGYARSTTSVLKNLQTNGLLKNWGIATSSSTSSAPSVQFLLTGTRIQDINSAKLDVTRMPTILQYAKTAGYRTIYFDGQLDNFWQGYASDTRFIDAYYGASQLNKKIVDPWEIDFEIAREVGRIVSTGTKNFIVINKLGVHLPYKKNYPDSAANWQPSDGVKTPVITVIGSNPFQQTINTYDNALRYNLSNFFSELLPANNEILKNSFILYTSDHGQGVENGTFHGGDFLSHATVPMMLIGNFENKLIDTSYNFSFR